MLNFNFLIEIVNKTKHVCIDAVVVDSNPKCNLLPILAGKKKKKTRIKKDNVAYIISLFFVTVPT